MNDGGPGSSVQLAGCGIADITGEAAGCGMLGYAKARQQTSGIHIRLRSRAFVLVDAATSRRTLLSVNDLPMVFESVRSEVLRRLSDRHGDAYHEGNVLITATHTHSAPGGYSYHRLYNTNTGGFRPLTFEAIVEGIVEAAERAHRDVSPAELVLGHAELLDASSNRSPEAFDRNPAAERALFPGRVDAQSSTLGIVRGGQLAGAVNFFATHGTSMTNRNRLVSGDNKGYASYHWERLVHGVDYLDSPSPSFVAAFAQTNAGDMSPNLNHRPGSGPTEDELENTKLIGERQFAAAAAALAAGVPLGGGIDSRTVYLDLTHTTVSPEFSGDGCAHATGSPCAGASSFAGTDEGPGFRAFRQGQNRLLDGVTRNVFYRLSPRLSESQRPKALLLPGGLINRWVPLVQERVPVQLVRIGRLHLLAIPAEATVVAGLRLRRTVARVVGTDVRDVLVVGYSNGYVHYVTTPEEYDAQRYEGGSTLFGRWELGAFCQAAAELATALRSDLPSRRDEPPPALKPPRAAKAQHGAGLAPPGRALGAVLHQPLGSYRWGQQVRVVVAGADPRRDLRRGGTYMVVERLRGDGWTRVADDGDWSTKVHWRGGSGGSELTLTWDVPAGTPNGFYRLRHPAATGDASRGGERLEAVSRRFEVRAP